MAKSLRSKWKKATRRLKAKKQAPVIAKQVENLNNKLDLCAKGGISKVPMQEANKNFTFANPKVDVSKPLVLDPLTTKVVSYGVDRPTENTRVHATHPSRQPGRFKQSAAATLTEEQATGKPIYGDLEETAVAMEGEDENEDDDGPEEVVLGFGSEEGMVSLATKTRKPVTGKNISGTKSTRVTKSSKPKSTKNKKK